MSEEIHVEEHSSPIKTPKQLIIVVFLAFAVPVILIVMLAQLVTSSIDSRTTNPGMSEEAIARRLKPVGDVVVTDRAELGAEKSGKEVYDAVCMACHGTGALNAPKLGDKAAWGKLIKDGFEKLTQSAIHGVRQMPQRGGNPDLSDAEVARAVAFIANQAGANWKEPEAKPLSPAQPETAAKAPASKPDGTAKAPAAETAKTGSAKGKSVYDAACVACHATGVAGAPKAGDKAAWAPRIKSGTETLYTSALKGKNAMPPKGGNPALPDADVKAAVDYMVSQVK